uniref:Uncharacterized protein n=1 Tax=Rhizophora mucronata TaxID=61149 RepID=A0A2P2N2L3_RHIMU
MVGFLCLSFQHSN